MDSAEVDRELARRRSRFSDYGRPLTRGEFELFHVNRVKNIYAALVFSAACLGLGLAIQFLMQFTASAVDWWTAAIVGATWAVVLRGFWYWYGRCWEETRRLERTIERDRDLRWVVERRRQEQADHLMDAFGFEDFADLADYLIARAYQQRAEPDAAT